MSEAVAPVDEMVDGAGGVRGHWRPLIGTFSTVGDGSLYERRQRLDRAFEEEGVTSVLPGMEGRSGVWHCDPVPLPLPAEEFRRIEAGLAQRAALLELVLQDLYGGQSLLADGVLPPAVVYGNPGFMRACRSVGYKPPPVLLHAYAADLLRGPDGQWRVMADRTAAPSGISYARENRRMLGRVMPEAFRAMQIRPLRGFFDIWQEALTGLATADRRHPAVAVLTPGTAHPQWFEHMYLARELSAVLAEGGDLTVRGGALFLKTLRGLQQIDVVLRRTDGRFLDPLEFDFPERADQGVGVTGLMDAARVGRVVLANDPGSGLLETAAFAAFMPALARHLLGEALTLPQVPTLWLGEAQAAERYARDPESWMLRPALREVSRRDPSPEWNGGDGRDFAAIARVVPSRVPCAGPEGLVPLPVVLRVFLVSDGRGWRAMPGGLARVLGDAEELTGRLPWRGLSKDVWVLSEESGDIVGPKASVAPPMRIQRRAAGELPSRIADTLYWFGRYVERLEDSARLGLAAARRLARGTPMPRDAAELEALVRCLKRAGMLGEEAGASAAIGGAALRDILLRSVRDGGRISRQFQRLTALTEGVRDRLTGEMYTIFTGALRTARHDAAAVDHSLDALELVLLDALRFCASVAGVTAENMVRAGGGLFLDLGRRIERAMATAGEIAIALDQPPARIEGGLRLVLELCDSAITYRSRYLTVLQPAPVLDLVLADDSNPRSLAFQLKAIAARLDEVAGRQDALSAAAQELLARVEALMEGLAASPAQAVAAAGLPPDLRGIESSVAALSDRIGRRYFALLPAAQALGTLAGAA